MKPEKLSDTEPQFSKKQFGRIEIKGTEDFIRRTQDALTLLQNSKSFSSVIPT